ncbi:MAG: SDR family NAD(P)-dependent oxidoreductase, partial [Comamonas sp.]
MSIPAQTRTVLVTGAARRLGRDMALALARAGWQVAVHYRDSREEAMQTVAACAELSGVSAAFD